MQIMIDTAVDSAAELLRIGQWLANTYASHPDSGSLGVQISSPPAPEPMTGPMVKTITVATSAVDVPTAPPPPFEPAPPFNYGGTDNDEDTEVSIDDDGNVATLTTSVSLPPAAPTPPGPAVAAELDKFGMPWDSRIHASNRAKKIDGGRKNKRGVSADLITAVEATNRPLVPATATLATTTAALSGAPAAPPAPIAPPPPPPMVGSAALGAAAPSAIDFRGLMQKIQSATAAGKLTAEQVNGALAGVGLKPEEMAQLINNAPLIASVNAAVDACLS